MVRKNLKNSKREVLLQKNKKKEKITKNTFSSWGSVADWYNDHLEKENDTFHKKIIYPNIFRILGKLQGKKVLDLACGQGQFSYLLCEKGAHVTGIDIAKELIDLAKSRNDSIKEQRIHRINFLEGSSDNLHMVKDATFDVVVCVLALQNIEKLAKTIDEIKRVLVQGGVFLFVLNHPSFRNLRQTSWGYDQSTNTQFRRIDEYMSESRVHVDMTPGRKINKKFTVSFHRPLQFYVKILTKAGFIVSHLEEWISHKESRQGVRQIAENKSRKEIPLFMCIQARAI